MPNILVCLFFLSSISLFNLAEGGKIRIPFAREDANYIWFPLDDAAGTLVPAFISGSPSSGVHADERDIHFMLFTADTPTTPEELILDNIDSITNSRFDSSLPVKIISHGFGGGSIQEGSSGVLKDAYVSAPFKANVIVIDWKKLSASPWYDTAAANTKITGAKTARFLEFLIDNQFTTLDKIHIIGHSLGAHVAGFAGAGLLVGKVPRITASDPALPLFGNVGDSERIDPTDGAFVDVVHTSGGPLTSGELAFMDPRGHVDFYPNGGKNQPGCTGIPELVGSCSHARSYEYISESVHLNSFTGCKCPTWEEFTSCDCSQTEKLGEYVSKSASGIYYLQTNSASPFGQN